MRDELIEMLLNSTPAKEYPKDFLNRSVSLVEKSALTLGPVVHELCKRMAGCESGLTLEEGAIAGKETKDREAKEAKEAKDANEDKKEESKEGEDGDTVPDMRNVLGFLNQGEWIGNLNIGNIM